MQCVLMGLSGALQSARDAKALDKGISNSMYTRGTTTGEWFRWLIQQFGSKDDYTPVVEFFDKCVERQIKHIKKFKDIPRKGAILAIDMACYTPIQQKTR